MPPPGIEPEILCLLGKIRSKILSMKVISAMETPMLFTTVQVLSCL